MEKKLVSPSNHQQAQESKSLAATEDKQVETDLTEEALARTVISIILASCIKMNSSSKIFQQVCTN